MNDYEGIEERIVINVKAFAKKLSIKNRNADLEDIEQDLMLHVIKGMRNFDPNLGDYDHFFAEDSKLCRKEHFEAQFSSAAYLSIRRGHCGYVVCID